MDNEERRRVRIRELTRLRVNDYRQRQRARTFQIHRGIDDILLEEIISDEEPYISISTSGNNDRGESDITSDVDEPVQVRTERCNEENEDNESEDSESEDYEEDGNEVQSDVEVDIHEASIVEEDFHDFDECSENTEIEELREWALSGNPTIPHTKLEALLTILRRRLLPELPKCAKTFLGTTKAHYSIQKFNDEGSEFVYFGATNHLKQSINPDLHENDIIQLIINVDGLQLFRSSSKQFWPILCQVYCETISYEPFPVAIYSGSKKPDNLDKFLEDFIVEMNELQQTGLLISDRLFNVSIKAFVCDTPARAFLKKIKGHGAYWGCERCTVQGEWIENRVIFPSDNCEERTDESFREQIDSNHHTGISPLINIRPPVNMIFQFVLDSMHLLCLGIMKKLLNYWLHSKRITKLSQSAQTLLSKRLITLQSQIPEEFQRTTRSLVDFEKFKAVEFKFILLYAGPVIFKNVLSEQVYKHFLLLHTACRVLC